MCVCFYVHDVHEKLCFFTIYCNLTSLADIAVRDLQSSQRNASVQSLILVGNFCTPNSSQPSAGEGEVKKSFEILGNKHNI